MTEFKFGLSTTVIEKIQDVLARHPTVVRAVIYGSRAKGNHKPGSDIDLTLVAAEDADAILDRLVHTSHRLDLKGASMRPRKEKKNQDE